MGIRFICPECEKRIHVKSFLAGKRGICPKCGGKVQIPTESESRVAASEANPPVPPGGYAPAVAPYGQAAPTVGQPVSVQPVSSAMANMGVVANGMPSGGAPMIMPGQPTAPVPSAAVGPVPVSPGVGPMPMSQPAPQATPQPAPQPTDPIAEAPSSKWYVRPQSGGQFGPAAGDVMRRWLTEGRVNPDSLVWREGWADWKKASSVFPEMGTASESTPVPTPPAPENEFAVPASSAGVAPYRGRRRKSSGMAIAMFIGLGVVAVGLLITLMVVLNQG